MSKDNKIVFSSDCVKISDKNLVDGLQSSGRIGTDVEFIKVEAAFGWCVGAACGSRMLVLRKSVGGGTYRKRWTQLRKCQTYLSVSIIFHPCAVKPEQPGFFAWWDAMPVVDTFIEDNERGVQSRKQVTTSAVIYQSCISSFSYEGQSIFVNERPSVTGLRVPNYLDWRRGERGTSPMPNGELVQIRMTGSKKQPGFWGQWCLLNLYSPARSQGAFDQTHRLISLVLVHSTTRIAPRSQILAKDIVLNQLSPIALSPDTPFESESSRVRRPTPSTLHVLVGQAAIKLTTTTR